MKIVVDASVAAKWYINEPDSEQALQWFDGDVDFVAPDLLVAEVANVLRRRMRIENLPENQARMAMTSLRNRVWHDASINELFDDAWHLSHKLNHSVYDCIYVALARLKQTGLLTSDNRLAKKLHQTGVLAQLYSPDNPVPDKTS